MCHTHTHTQRIASPAIKNRLFWVGFIRYGSPAVVYLGRTQRDHQLPAALRTSPLAQWGF
jgi:hypothetical protein